MSKNVQAESNVRQARLNGIAEAQPLFCKEHFISCFVFCSFVLSYDSDEVGAFYFHLFSNPVFDRPEKGNRLPLAVVRKGQAE